MGEYPEGAGPQCTAIAKFTGKRCMNGGYGSPALCPAHDEYWVTSIETKRARQARTKMRGRDYVDFLDSGLTGTDVITLVGWMKCGGAQAFDRFDEVTCDG